jgi:hypothetical protein
VRPSLEQLIDALAAYLADLRIRANLIEAEISCGDLRLRLAREVPEGEHDLAGAAVTLLEDAATLLNTRPELAGRPIEIGVVP